MNEAKCAIKLIDKLFLIDELVLFNRMKRILQSKIEIKKEEKS